MDQTSGRPVASVAVRGRVGSVRWSASSSAESSSTQQPVPDRGEDFPAAARAVVGGDESSEFLRQSATIVRAWGEQGVTTRYEEIAGANHFTVIAPLTDPASDMCARLKQLAEQI